MKLRLIFIFIIIIGFYMGCTTQKHVVKQSVNHLDMGNKMLRVGKLDSAEDHFRQILTGDPNNGAAIMGLGQIYLEKGDDYRAEQFLRKALIKDPSLSKANGLLGQIYLDRDDEKKAMEYFAKCDSDDPYYAELHYRLGRDHLKKGERMKARNEFELALTHDNFWGGHWGMGCLDYYDNDKESALEHFQQATLLSDHPEANYSAAECMFSMGMDEQAYFHYLRYLSELPEGEHADEAKQNIEQIRSKFDNIETVEKIKFNLQSDKDIKINIYDENGHHLKNLYSGFLCRGKYEMGWDGFDAKGNSCDGRNFFGIVTCGDSTIIQKLSPLESSAK